MIGYRYCTIHGLIPAHAGKTGPPAPLSSHRRDHPRSRGENSMVTVTRAGSMGSSPLTRGKLGCREARSRAVGLIPAHAGKTVSSRRKASSGRAHPRSRGENVEADDIVWLRDGSSPLTRGKRDARAEFLVGGGLIPAHAGKTKLRARVLVRRRAHPRSRGENWAAAKLEVGQSGSSPLTRGKHLVGGHARRGGRLIPAHAGKTTPQGPRPPAKRAHPRSRGENVRMYSSASMNWGSSPLTRGKRGRAPAPRVGDRLIPAHAGKTRRN